MIRKSSTVSIGSKKTRGCNVYEHVLRTFSSKKKRKQRVEFRRDPLKRIRDIEWDPSASTRQMASTLALELALLINEYLFRNGQALPSQSQMKRFLPGITRRAYPWALWSLEGKELVEEVGGRYYALPPEIPPMVVTPYARQLVRVDFRRARTTHPLDLLREKLDRVIRRLPHDFYLPPAGEVSDINEGIMHQVLVSRVYWEFNQERDLRIYHWVPGGAFVIRPRNLKRLQAELTVQ